MISQNAGKLLLNTFVSGSTSVRNYGRRVVNPKAVTNANVSRSGRRYPTREERIANSRNVFENVEPDVQDVFDSFSKPRLDLTKLPQMYEYYEQEKLDEKYQARKWRTINKHFKDYMKPDICLLTYAEKEQLRYLHETDPEEWSEENLAASFPISLQSVQKLLKSPFRCLNAEAIRNHDARVAEQLEKIKAGEIELSPELEQKMEIRRSIPVQFGAISTPELGLLAIEKPKKLGPFARLVTPNAPPAEEDDDDEEIIQKQNGAKRFNKRNSRTKSKMSASMQLKSSQVQRLDVSESHKAPPTEQESKFLESLNRKRMTLTEFETEIQNAQKSGKTGQLPETEQQKFAYLLSVQSQGQATPAPILPGIEEYVPDAKDLVGRRARIQKYANISKDKVELNVEKGEAYIYKSDTGLQKPFAQRRQRVRLPSNAEREGSVYKVGDSYYDESGEFLYRPV